MKAGEFENGARVLRAKIDMASGNINMRDPTLYRIVKAPHPRTGTKWSIYPSYDYAHGQSDAIEGITHSICTLEFEDHRPLYDWFLENLPVPSKPRQYEMARLNLTYTVLSKRVLNTLVRDGHVRGWDDPRMPTLAGLRRRGVPPAALRDFVKRIGVAKANSTVDAGMLDFSIRETLNKTALRRMAVLRPLKVVIENYEGPGEELDAVNHPDDPAAGSRKIAFGRELYIEQDDFMENPPKKFFRLSPGTEVRLRYAYFITCREAVKNDKGEVVELRCTYDPATRGGNAPDGRKVKATIHWVSAAASKPAEVRLYNPLFTKPDPKGGEGFTEDLNPNSLEVLRDARVEPRWPRAATRPTRCSSSGRAISSSIRTRRPTGRCSTAPSDCAIPSPRRSARADPSAGPGQRLACRRRCQRAGRLIGRSTSSSSAGRISIRHTPRPCTPAAACWRHARVSRATGPSLRRGSCSPWRRSPLERRALLCCRSRNDPGLRDEPWSLNAAAPGAASTRSWICSLRRPKHGHASNIAPHKIQSQLHRSPCRTAVPSPMARRPPASIRTMEDK